MALNLKYPVDVVKSFYGFQDDRQEELNELNNSLRKAKLKLAKNKASGEAKTYTTETKTSISAIVNEIEYLLTPIMIYLADTKLRANKLNKVILYFNSVESVRRSANKLRSYKPVVVTGEVDLQTRRKQIKLFNTSDLSRLYIGTTAAGKESLSLHDTKGGRERWMYISANLVLSDMIQAAGRIRRRGLESQPHVRFILGFPRTSNQFEKSLSSKAKTGGEVIHGQASSNYLNWRKLESESIIIQ